MSFIRPQDSREFLQKSLIFFAQEMSLVLKIGLEIEFSLIRKREDASEIAVLQDSILTIAGNNAISLLHFEKEQGEFQYEIAVKHDADILAFADRYFQLKNIIKESADFHGYEVDFAALTGDNYSNSLHIHISLWRSEKNLFAKNPASDLESEYMNYAVAGILTHAKSLCLFALSCESDFGRFKAKFSLEKHRIRHETSNTNSPTHIAWGSNNRTCLVRIVDSYKDRENRHIEYRLSVPEADIYMVIASLILAIYLGLKGKKDPIAKTYGNAYDPQYGLESLPKSSEVSFREFENDTRFNKLFNRFLDNNGK